MTEESAKQHAAFENRYEGARLQEWEFHVTPDPLTRYLRDRRMLIGLDWLRKHSSLGPEASVLIICGGPGGEGVFFANHGFQNVTVSDFSTKALEFCRQLDPRLQTLQLDAEKLAIPDESFDLVVVQDGLHHLRRPTVGFTEMLRTARKAVMVIEPHHSLVADLIGTEWEVTDSDVNYVFRWDYTLVRQLTLSYFAGLGSGRVGHKVEYGTSSRDRFYKLRDVPAELTGLTSNIKVLRKWSHSLIMGNLARVFGGAAVGLAVVKIGYQVLDIAFPWMANNMIAIVRKPEMN